MSLRFKVLLFVVVISLGFVGASWLVQRSIMQPEFSRLELREADDDRLRVVEAIGRELDFLSRFANDYAAWDDTYAFLRDRNERYRRANLVIETFDNSRLDVMAYFLTDGSLAWGQARDGDSLAPAVELIGLLRTQLPVLLPTLRPNSRQHGMLRTATGTLLVGAAPITNTDLSGAVRGSIVVGRWLTDSIVARLAAQTGVGFALHRTDSLAPEEQAILARVTGPDPVWRDPSDPTLLRSYSTVADFEGHPALLLRTDLPREVLAGARRVGSWATAVSVGAGLLMSLVMWLVLTRMIVSPLSRVTRHAVQVGAGGQLHARLGLAGTDEIAVLGGEFDRMVTQLEESQRRLVVLARDAGRSEIAQDVLHNVGNVLNSAHVSASLAARTLEGSEIPSLGLAAQLLEEHRHDLGAFLEQDARGRHLPAFLSELSGQLASEHATLTREVGTVSTSLEHIREIVRSQNEHAGAPALIERIDPAVVIDQALALTADSRQRHQIRLERAFAPEGALLLDRHRLLQILSNLLTNAKQAIRAGAGADPCIRVGLERRDREAGAQVVITVSDTGIGIPPERLTQIFAGGFSTRAGSHGRGLHSAANLARALGGELTATSDGPGTGACFTLTMPLVRPVEPA